MSERLLHEDSKAIKVSIRIDVIVLVIQFIVLASSMIYSYAKLSAEVSQVKYLMEGHVSQESTYVREDVWKTRNIFIDQKLDNIERKIDVIIIQKAVKDRDSSGK